MAYHKAMGIACGLSYFILIVLDCAFQVLHKVSRPRSRVVSVVCLPKGQPIRTWDSDVSFEFFTPKAQNIGSLLKAARAQKIGSLLRANQNLPCCHTGSVPEAKENRFVAEGGTARSSNCVAHHQAACASHRQQCNLLKKIGSLGALQGYWGRKNLRRAVVRLPCQNGQACLGLWHSMRADAPLHLVVPQEPDYTPSERCNRI